MPNMTLVTKTQKLMVQRHNHRSRRNGRVCYCGGSFVVDGKSCSAAPNYSLTKHRVTTLKYGSSSKTLERGYTMRQCLFKKHPKRRKLSTRQQKIFSLSSFVLSVYYLVLFGIIASVSGILSSPETALLRRRYNPYDGTKKYTTNRRQLIDNPFLPDYPTNSCKNDKPAEPWMSQLASTAVECCTAAFGWIIDECVNNSKVATLSPSASPTPVEKTSATIPAGGGRVVLPLIPMHFLSLPSDFDLNDAQREMLESIVSDAAAQWIMEFNVDLLSVNIVEETWNHERVMLVKWDRQWSINVDKNEYDTTLSTAESHTHSNKDLFIRREDNRLLENYLTIWLEIIVMESIFTPNQIETTILYANQIESTILNAFQDNKSDIVDMLKESWGSDLITEDVILEIGDIETTSPPSPLPTKNPTDISNASPLQDVSSENEEIFLPSWVVVIFALLFIILFGVLIHCQMKKDKIDELSVKDSHRLRRDERPRDIHMHRERKRLQQ